MRGGKHLKIGIHRLSSDSSNDATAAGAVIPCQVVQLLRRASWIGQQALQLPTVGVDLQLLMLCMLGFENGIEGLAVGG